MQCLKCSVWKQNTFIFSQSCKSGVLSPRLTVTQSQKQSDSKPEFLPWSLYQKSVFGFIKVVAGLSGLWLLYWVSCFLQVVSRVLSPLLRPPMLLVPLPLQIQGQQDLVESFSHFESLQYPFYWILSLQLENTPCFLGGIGLPR